MTKSMLLALVLVCGCGGTVDGPDVGAAAAAGSTASSSSSGGTTGSSSSTTGTGGGGCPDCSPALACDCHPAGTPPAFCSPCGAGGGGGS